jgi:hypothetical protein
MYHENSERQAHEVFVGNTTHVNGLPEHLRGLKTARIGKQAYDIYGGKLPTNEYRPLFIGKAEEAAYDTIMMARVAAVKRGQ